MRFLRSRATASEGSAYVSEIVHSCGAIFRELQTDVGIDGIIEFVDEERATGELVAVQIKSGHSYVSDDGKAFMLPADKAHFVYWNQYSIPVAGIVYDPKTHKAVWVNITGLLRENPELVEKGPYTIGIPETRRFNVTTFLHEFRETFRHYRELADLFEYANLMLSAKVSDRWKGFLGLIRNPTSRFSPLTCYLLVHGISDNDVSLRGQICDALARYLPHPEVGFFPPKELRAYVEQLISINLGRDHICKMLEAVDENGFERGSLGQSIAEVIRAIPKASKHLCDIAVDDDVNHEVRFASIVLLGYLVFEDALPFLQRYHAVAKGDIREAVEWAIQELRSYQNNE